MTEDYKPRLSIQLEPEQRQRLDNLNLPWGLQRAIFSQIVDDLCDLIETHGSRAVGALLDGAIRPRDVISSMSKADKPE